MDSLQELALEWPNIADAIKECVAQTVQLVGPSKMECLDLAVGMCMSNGGDPVEMAKTFYAWVSAQETV